MAEPTTKPADPMSPSAIIVSPSVVSGWLGLTPGETLTAACTHPSGSAQRAAGWFLVWAALIVGLLACSQGPDRRLLGRVAVVIVLAGLATLFAHRGESSRGRRVLVVRAGGDALELKTTRGWQRLAWSDLDSLDESTDGGATLNTASGRFWLSDDLDCERLLSALEWAVAAGRAGEQLPSGGVAASKGAVSLVDNATADDAAVSRGGP